MMYDLMVLAFQTDSTRVASFLVAHDGSNRSYPFIGVPDGHHDLSHHNSDEVKLAKIAKINTFHTTQFAYFLGKLKATPDGDGFRINGRKWLITGAEGAGCAIIMARNEGGPMDGHATMFLADLPDPAIRIERTLDTMDSSFTGGHGVLEFDNLRLPADSVLGEVGKGFRYAQVRLAPARLSHCMRWLGSAMRAQDIAADYARNRVAFGKKLGEHEGVSFMLAHNLMDMHTARLSIWHTAWLLDQGHRAANESSMAKVICSEAYFRIADRCMQILGGLGITRDTVVERIFRDIRAFRIYDGPSEVHRWALGARIVSGKM